jgi:hypothetical protein
MDALRAWDARMDALRAWDVRPIRLGHGSDADSGQA